MLGNRSFVTGFMGMNTNDIRNMDNNQKLYWEVALPVTVVVLAVAFVYGYAGDLIVDWFHDRTNRKGDRKRPMMHPEGSLSSSTTHLSRASTRISTGEKLDEKHDLPTSGFLRARRPVGEEQKTGATRTQTWKSTDSYLD
jgi:hypothetical protein